MTVQPKLAAQKDHDSMCCRDFLFNNFFNLNILSNFLGQ